MKSKSIDIYGKRHPKRGALVANPIPVENVFWYDIFQPIVDAINKLYTGASKPYKSGDGIYVKADGTINLTRELFSTINGQSILQGQKDIKIIVPDNLIYQGENDLTADFILKGLQEKNDNKQRITIKKEFAELQLENYKDVDGGYGFNIISNQNVAFIKSNQYINTIAGKSFENGDITTAFVQKYKDIELTSNVGKIDIHSYSSMTLESKNNKIVLLSKGMNITETGDIKIDASGRKVEINDSKTINMTSTTGYTINTKEFKVNDENGNVILGGKNDILYVKKRFEVEEPNRQNSMKLYTDGFEVLTYNSDKSISNRITFSPSKNGFNFKRGDYNGTDYDEQNIFRIDDTGDVYIRKNGQEILLQDNLGGSSTIKIGSSDIDLSTGFTLGSSISGNAHVIKLEDNINHNTIVNTSLSFKTVGSQNIVGSGNISFKTINGSSIVGSGDINTLSPYISHSYDSTNDYEKTDIKNYNGNYLIRDNYANIRYFGKTGNAIIKSGESNVEFNNNDGTRYVQFSDDKIKIYAPLRILDSNNNEFFAVEENRFTFKCDGINLIEVNDSSGITIGHYKQGDTYLEFKKDGDLSNNDLREYFRLVSAGQQILKAGYDQRYRFGSEHVITINHPDNFYNNVLLRGVGDYIGIGQINETNNSYNDYVLYITEGGNVQFNSEAFYIKSSDIINLTGDNSINLTGDNDINLTTNNNSHINLTSDGEIQLNANNGDINIIGNNVLNIESNTSTINITAEEEIEIKSDVYIHIKSQYSSNQTSNIYLEDYIKLYSYNELNNITYGSYFTIFKPVNVTNGRLSEFKFEGQGDDLHIYSGINTSTGISYVKLDNEDGAYIQFKTDYIELNSGNELYIYGSDINIDSSVSILLEANDYITLQDSDNKQRIEIEQDSGITLYSNTNTSAYNKITLTIGATTLVLDETKLQQLAALLA